jgi:hypothetical protein
MDFSAPGGENLDPRTSEGRAIDWCQERSLMKHGQSAWCPGLVAAFLLGGSLEAVEKIPPQPLDGKIRWVYDYDEGQAEARRTGRPMFVVVRCER